MQEGRWLDHRRTPPLTSRPVSSGQGWRSEYMSSAELTDGGSAPPEFQLQEKRGVNLPITKRGACSSDDNRNEHRKSPSR
jgi:hypothetical protein